MLRNNLLYLTLKLTNRCNLNCAMCGQVYSPDRASEDEISVESINRILDDAKKVKQVYLFGGEPLLYSKFDALLDALENRDISIHITTNGTLLEKYAEKIVSCGVSSVEISMDSCDRDNFNRIRGRHVYDDIINGIRRLKEEKEKQRKMLPLISINFVILPCNFRELRDFVKYVKNDIVGVEHIFFQYPMLTNEKQGLLQERINKEEFGVSCESWKWFDNNNQMFTDEEIKYIFNELKEIESYSGVDFKKVRSIEELKKMFRGERDDTNYPCECPFVALTVLPNGDAVFCPDFPDIKLGNVYEISINEIWNSENSQRFRKHLLSYGNYPICKSCYHIDEKFE